MTQNLARTKDEALLEIRYAMRLHELHSRLYRRLQFCVTFFTALLGAGALSSALQGISGWVAATGVALAILSAYSVAVNLPALEARHDAARREFTQLYATCLALDIASIDAQLFAVREADRYDVEALRWVAMNDTLRTLGIEQKMRPESAWQSVVRTVA